MLHLWKGLKTAIILWQTVRNNVFILQITAMEMLQMTLQADLFITFWHHETIQATLTKYRFQIYTVLLWLPAVHHLDKLLLNVHKFPLGVKYLCILRPIVLKTHPSIRKMERMMLGSMTSKSCVAPDHQSIIGGPNTRLTAKRRSAVQTKQAICRAKPSGGKRRHCLRDPTGDFFQAGEKGKVTTSTLG